MRYSLAALFMLLLVISVYAEDFVAINSNDGRDVLSGVFYANVKGLPVKFMPSQGGDPDIFADEVGEGHSILLIQSSSEPISVFVQNSLSAKNNSVSLYLVNDSSATNLDLAVKSGASSFIIVDSAYSDSAISVLPYAALTHSYVIMADKTNIAQVEGIVQGKNVTIYGLVDSEVKSGLAADNPQYIGNGEDKFLDNIMIVNKTMSQFGMDHIIISDGSFLEDSIAKGDQPVLFVGSLVPQPTYDFVKEEVAEGKLNGVMLIGSNLIVPVYDMRKSIQSDFQALGENKTFGIIVKFAQVVPSAGTGTLTLDTFNMPVYRPVLSLGDVVYNSQGGQVMVSLNNSGDGPAFYSIQLTVLNNGNQMNVFGGDNISLIESGEVQTAQFPLNLSAVTEGNLTYTALVKFGSSAESLDQFSSESGNLTTINYVDKSNVSVEIAKYDPVNDQLLVTLRNNGNSEAYAFSKATLIIQGQPTNISAPAVMSIDPSSLAVEEFPVQLSQSDLASNSNVSILLNYGGRPSFLVNSAIYVVGLEGAQQQFPLLPLLVLVVIIAVVAAAIIFLKKEKPKKKK